MLFSKLKYRGEKKIYSHQRHCSHGQPHFWESIPQSQAWGRICAIVTSATLFYKLSECKTSGTGQNIPFLVLKPLHAQAHPENSVHCTVCVLQFEDLVCVPLLGDMWQGMGHAS